MSAWIFGYGSLIWRPDFPFVERRRARLHGWQRRFWQGSHDHRGVPQRPGRVVTLAQTGSGHCDGVAYRLDDATADGTFLALDHREKNGYQRHRIRLELGPAVALGPDLPSGADSAEGSGSTRRRDAPSRTVAALVYLAPMGNHAYLGPAPLADMARQIATCEGPSGANAAYLMELAQALRMLGVEDPHVMALEAAVQTFRS